MHAYFVKGCQPINNYCIYSTDYEMVCFLDFRLSCGSFLVNLSKNHDFCQNKKKKKKKKKKTRGLLYAFSAKSWQPIMTDFIYATDFEME